MKITAIYKNREGEEWKLGHVTSHPFAPLVFVMAVRSDGRTVCVEKAKLKLVDDFSEVKQQNEGTK